MSCCISRAALILSLFLFQGVFARDFRGGLSDAQSQRQRTEILGIEVGSSSAQVSSKLAKMGMKAKSQKLLSRSKRLRLFEFEGIPEGLAIREGTTRLLFFEDKLVRIDFFFAPTYKNYLLVKNQLFSSMGGRFDLEKQNESMDGMLRAHLAALGRNEYDAESEMAVQKALARGTTFFFYNIQDKQDQLNVTFSFLAKKNDGGQKRPELLLHYSEKAEMQRLRSLGQRSAKAILPNPK